MYFNKRAHPSDAFFLSLIHIQRLKQFKKYTIENGLYIEGEGGKNIQLQNYATKLKREEFLELRDPLNNSIFFHVDTFKGHINYFNFNSTK